MKVNIQKFSQVLLKIRISKGFSQLFMAQNLGICQKTYSYIESGKSIPDVVKIIKIAIVTETYPLILLEPLIEGKTPWEGIEKQNKSQISELEKLKAEIRFLKSQNEFLQKTINKLLEMQ